MSETIQSLLNRSVRRLAATGVDGARLDVEVLLMHLLDVDRAHLYLKFPETTSPELTIRLEELLVRRIAGEPVAYLIGHREFMGLDFVVDQRVLIPRPETEGLVERALAWLDHHSTARKVADVGTGSGAIAISLDLLAPKDRDIRLFGSDLSREALDVARINRVRLGAVRVNLINGYLLDWARGEIDLIVANLPYLRDEQRHPGIAREPEHALFAMDAGFRLYRQLIPQAAGVLATPGALMCEIDPDQRTAALETAASAFPGAALRVDPDLAGRDRYLIVERKP